MRTSCTSGFLRPVTPQADDARKEAAGMLREALGLPPPESKKALLRAADEAGGVEPSGVYGPCAGG